MLLSVCFFFRALSVCWVSLQYIVSLGLIDAEKRLKTHIHTCNGVFLKVFVSWELHFNPIKPGCMPHGLTHYTAQTITRCWVRYMCPFWNTVLLDLQTARRLRTSRPNSARPLKVHSLLLDCYNLSVFFLPAVSSVIKCKSMHLTCDLCAVPYHLFFENLLSGMPAFRFFKVSQRTKRTLQKKQNSCNCCVLVQPGEVH